MNSERESVFSSGQLRPGHQDGMQEAWLLPYPHACFNTLMGFWELALLSYAWLSQESESRRPY